MFRIEQNGRMSLGRPKPPTTGGSAPDEEDNAHESKICVYITLSITHDSKMCVCVCVCITLSIMHMTASSVCTLP